jgi:cell division protein FtsL
VLAAWTVYPVLRIQYQHERELQTLQAELDGLKTRNETLREQVDRLKTPEGVEQAARESLGMVKPGEQAYVVTGGTLGETSATVLVDGEPEPPLWQQALDALFGL